MTPELSSGRTEMTSGSLRNAAFKPLGLALTALMMMLTGAFAAYGFPRHWDDSTSYIAMAEGLPALMPWAGRILLPYLVQNISRIFDLSLDHSFEAITCLAFTCWMLVTSRNWQDTNWFPCFFVMPLIVSSLQSVYITDMFHMGLAALFFWLFRRNAFFASGFMVIMMTARESSMIFAFVGAGALLCNRKWFAGAAMIVAYLVGASIVHHATQGAQNVHRMPEFLYFLTKIPLNFLRNWLGVLVWTNGYAWCDNPIVRVGFPASLHFGIITRIGFCAPSVGVPLSTASSYVTIFGVLPAILIAVVQWDGIPRKLWREAWWTTAFVGGTLMLLLGPLAGAPVDREIGFGWPLFYLALPMLRNNTLEWRIAALQVCAGWGPVFLNYLLQSSTANLSFTGISMEPVVAALSLIVGTVANIAAYRITKSRITAQTS